jgi:hypothetical protein
MDFNEDKGKTKRGQGGPYYGLLGLGEMAGWASGDGILPRLKSINDGATPRSFDGYKE